MKKSLFAIAILAFTAVSHSGDYSTWAKYRNLTLNTSGITTTPVKKIPLLIRFSEALQSDMFTGSTAALASGADLRVTKADGSTDIPFEVDNWTVGTGGSGALWVLLDSVPANSAVGYSLRVYWNKSGATTASNPSAVFDTANGFLAVWHFNEAAGASLVSATVNGPTAAPGAAGAAPTNMVNSVIGAGKMFAAASSQYYQVGADSNALRLNSNTGPYTITAWVNPTSCAARIAAISKYANNNNAGTRQYALQTANTTDTWRLTNNPTTFASLTANNEYVADAAGACVTDTWTYLSGGYNTSGAQPTADATGAAFTTLSVNGGVPITGVTASQATGTSIGTAANTFIGKIASNERYMDGTLDEITVSKVTRTADWTKLSYETQKPGASTIVIGSTTTNLAGAPSITSQPSSRSATVGTAVKFGVTATGTAPLTYKWVRRNTDTVGTNSDTLNLTNVSSADTGSYKCVVRNSISVAISNSASLTVTPVGIFAHAPTSSFKARVSGSAVVFEIPKGLSNIRISVMDLKGREVWSHKTNGGRRAISWDGKTASGASVALGVYSARLFSDEAELAEARIVLSH